MRSTKIIKICSSSLCTCLHHMVILRTRNKITDFFMILAWASPFNLTCMFTWDDVFLVVLDDKAAVDRFVMNIEMLIIHIWVVFQKLLPLKHGNIIWMASCTSGLTHIEKTMKIHVIDSNNLINIRVSNSRLDHLVTDFVTFFVLICIYSFYPVLHVAARFFLKIVKMWVSPLVHDAIHI